MTAYDASDVLYAVVGGARQAMRVRTQGGERGVEIGRVDVTNENRRR